jgi:hypothetical protein
VFPILHAGTQAYNGRVDQQEAAHAPQHETITRVVQPGDVLDVLTAIQLISLQVIPCGTPIPGPALTDSSSPLPHQPHNTQPLPIRCIVVTYQRGVLEAHQAAGPGPVARWCMYDRGCLIDRRLQAVETCWALQGCWSSTGTYISELCHALLLPDPPCSPSIVATRLAALADAITTLGDLGGLQRYARCSITLLSSMQALHCKAVSDGDSALQGVVRHLASSVLGAGMAASLVTGVGNNAAAGRSSSGTQAGASTASLGTAAPATGGANVPAAAAASKPATLSAGKPASAAPVHASTACPAPPGSPPAPGAASAGIPSAAVPASKAAPTATGITASASASGLSATVLQAGPPKVQPGEDSQAPPVSGGAPIVITTLSELNQLLASLQVPKGDKAAQGWDVEVDLGGQTLCGSSGISITPATQQATQHLRHRWRPCLYCQWHPAAPGRGSHQSEPGGSPATEESHCHWHWGIIGPV